MVIPNAYDGDSSERSLCEEADDLGEIIIEKKLHESRIKSLPNLFIFRLIIKGLKINNLS